MSDVEHRRSAAVEGVLRSLADFNDKLAVAERDLVWWLWGVGLVAVALVVEVASLVASGDAPVWVFVTVVLVAGIVARLASGSRITMVQLAAWRLRRVYELASRMEDMGRALDTHQRLELELRLSEAQFLLNRAEWLGQPSSKAARLVMRQRMVNAGASSEATPSATSKDDDPRALPEFLDRPVP